MPIGFILSNLLARAESATGVTFLDTDGEAIETVCSDLEPEAVRRAGVLAQIYFRRLTRAVPNGDEQTDLLHIEGEQCHIHALGLKDGFLLVVVQRAPSLASQTRLALRSAGSQLEREILS